MSVLAILLAVLGLLFAMNAHAKFGKFFKIIPLLVFAYFVPTLLSNTGVIPTDSKFGLYTFIKTWLLPASLVLLTLSVDLKAVMGLGRNAVVLFLGATVSIVLGGPIAYLLCMGVGKMFGFELISPEFADQAWRGLAALSGTWIGGGANFLAMQEEFDASESIITLMVVVDVAIANVWMAVLLLFAGREKEMDEKMGADRSSLDAVREKVAQFQATVSKPTTLAALLTISAIAIIGAVVATWAGGAISVWLKEYWPWAGGIMKEFTWVVIFVTLIGLTLSFTPVRKLEGSGASAVGSVFLYLLVTTIGAKAEFSKIFDPANTGILIIGAVWMLFHIAFLMLLRRYLKAPIFFVAVGSKANIGGAASAPIVASAFHPALATVGVLLATFGYVLGTGAAIICGNLLRMAHNLVFG
ncbi:MAG: DUF819 family protein [Planctomycetes bacterium]|nr:DUF819 family protein [Planctomycetota bacterium]